MVGEYFGHFDTIGTERSNQTSGHTFVQYPQIQPMAVNYVQPTEPKPERKKKPMRGLFEVFIVNPENDTLWAEIKVIANDGDGARMKAVRSGIPPEKDPEDYGIIVRRIGDVRAKTKVKEVRVLKD